MYAVIKTGGKQYRVQPGDLLVVEKLDGEPGAEIAFGEVLMLGGADGVTVGAPLIDGASVTATLIETRKGDKVYTVKKIRRQGYRRHKNHRQPESVLRVTGLAGGGVDEKWDGEVDLTPRATLRARARNLAPRAAQPIAEDHALVVQDEAPDATQAPKAAAKKAPAKKAAPTAAKTED
jgi:large subunit ribosomal protein L21